MIINGNNIEELKKFNDNYFDSIVTDPPYEIGFMGKSWDASGIANNPEMWAECLRVLKPGGYLLSFSATRTYHRMAVAIEDSGFEIRDMIEWVYGSGFPKSLNIGKAVDKRGGTTSGQSIEFAEYIKNRRTELNITFSKADEIVCGGTTNYSWFEGRPSGQRLPRKSDYLKMKELLKLDDRYDSFMEETEREFIGKSISKSGISSGNGNSNNGSTWNKVASHYEITKGTSEFEGKGTALKPAHEPICMARKPLAEKTVAENVLKYGTGGINIDESRVGCDLDIEDLSRGRQSNGGAIFGSTNKEIKIEANNLGRFPANLIHDNSEEVRECFPETGKGSNKPRNRNTIGSFGMPNDTTPEYADSGNASRFFKSIIYQAKASKSERNKGLEDFEDKERVDYGGFHSEKGLIENNRNPENRLPNKNNHPTVKPIALMEYLIKMVTPKGGIVLDPFMGSGTTGVACVLNDFEFVGIDLDKDYCEIARARIEGAKEKLLGERGINENFD